MWSQNAPQYATAATSAATRAINKRFSFIGHVTSLSSKHPCCITPQYMSHTHTTALNTAAKTMQHNTHSREYGAGERWHVLRAHSRCLHNHQPF